MLHILYFNSKNSGVTVVSDVFQKKWWKGCVECFCQKRKLEFHLDMKVKQKTLLAILRLCVGSGAVLNCTVSLFKNAIASLAIAVKLGQNLSPKTVPKCSSSQHQHSITWYKPKMGSTQRLLGLLLRTMANSCPARVQ